MRTQQCLVRSCNITSNCSSETIRLGEGTDPNIAVLCSNHLDYIGLLERLHKRDLEKVAKANGYKGSFRNHLLDRLLKDIEINRTEAESKKF